MFLKIVSFFLFLNLVCFSTSVKINYSKDIAVSHFINNKNATNEIYIKDYGDVSVILHEIGHHMASILGIPKEFEKAVLEYKVTRRPMFFPKGDTRMLRDIYSALSRGKANTGFGHSEKYYSSDFNVVHEVYANLYVIWVRNELDNQDNIKRNFPKIHEEWSSHWKNFYRNRGVNSK